jgi:hypothetical protein
MKIDCHCHVFNNDCIPAVGLLQSRFGIVVESGLLDAVSADAGDEELAASIKQLGVLQPGGEA